MDLEMTGLDIDRHVIVEIATLVTDDELPWWPRAPTWWSRPPPSSSRPWTTSSGAMHTKSGLLDEIAASTLTLEEAGDATLAFIRTHVPKARTVPLAGNSIGTDRRFLAAQLPGHRGVPPLPLGRRLHRQGAGPRWFPEVMEDAPAKAGGHRAMDDIRESVAELAYYRSHLFRPAQRRPVVPATADHASRGASEGPAVRAARRGGHRPCTDPGRGRRRGR